jgi:hypothetical protein
MSVGLAFTCYNALVDIGPGGFYGGGFWRQGAYPDVGLAPYMGSIAASLATAAVFLRQTTSGADSRMRSEASRYAWVLVGAMALALVVVVAKVFAAQAALVDPYALSIVAQVVVGNALRLVQPILIAYAAVRHQLLEANVRIR